MIFIHRLNCTCILKKSRMFCILLALYCYHQMIVCLLFKLRSLIIICLYANALIILTNIVLFKFEPKPNRMKLETVSHRRNEFPDELRCPPTDCFSPNLKLWSFLLPFIFIHFSYMLNYFLSFNIIKIF